jgi:hypothetical protein
MSSEDKYVDNLRISILDQAWVRPIFNYLREYYRGESYDDRLDPILNLLEASILNANAELEVFARLFKEVVQRNEVREQVLTQIRDKMHETDKEFKEFKDKGVHEIIKEYVGGGGGTD